jgi:DNA-binding MarR family transcriptional regulator
MRIYAPAMRREPAASPSRTQNRSRYRDNLARHLMGVSRDLELRVRQALSEDLGFLGLRPSFGPLLSLIWDEGRPLTAIAGELAISKQACGQLANLAESAGYLERRPNPQDRRSKLVMLTPRGRALVEEAVRVILESESEYAALVGADAYRSFTRALAALFQGLGLPTHADPALTARASQSVGVLPLISVRIQRELMEATIARGHGGLKMSHAQVLPLVGPEGARIHEIARSQRVSRQAISAISQELEALGYLRREPDPQDRRGVVLMLTSRGASLIRDAVAAIADLERAFREVLGERRLAQLQRVSSDLYQGLQLDAEAAPGEQSALEASPAAEGSRRDIHRLATSLRRELGRGDAARLAALLEPGARRSAT